MKEEILNEMITDWEHPKAEVVRVIDSSEGTVERIVKVGDAYSLYRYFEIGGITKGEYIYKVVCSVDLIDVDADRVICELAERL
jgi:hypothetical protein